MKRTAYALLLLSIALFSPLSSADEQNEGTFFGHDAPGKWIIGIKAAQVEYDGNDDRDGTNAVIRADEADGIGIILGYEFARPVGFNGSSTIEFEYIKADDTDIQIGPFFTEYNADIYSLYFTYRSAGTLYWKAKGGIQHSSIDIVAPAIGAEEDNDTGFAFGIGLGYRIQDYGVIELEYSKDTGDNDLGIFGINALLEF